MCVVCTNEKSLKGERMRLWREAEAENCFVVSSHILMPNKTILLNAADPDSTRRCGGKATHGLQKVRLKKASRLNRL